MRCFLPLLVGFLLVGAIEAASPELADDFNFLAMGDWGGHNEKQPATQDQRLTARGLARVARDAKVAFTLMMGDNFYDHGIHPQCPTVSPRFQETFEDVYGSVLPEQTFYVLAGNHDYGEGMPANVSAQVAYSQVSTRWVFPKLWYDIKRNFTTAEGHSRSLQVLVIDTVVLCGRDELPDELVDEQLRFLGRPVGPEPGDLRKYWAELHWQWLEEQLATSTADYLLVAGHFPIWSAGEDGPTPCLIERLRPLLKASGAHYVSGHDHNLEHIAEDGVNMFVVGIGKECCYKPTHMHQMPPGALRYLVAGANGRKSLPPAPYPIRGGFAGFHFGAEGAHARFYDHNGAVLYTTDMIPRRVAVAERRRATSLATGPSLGGDLDSWPGAVTAAFCFLKAMCVGGLVVMSTSVLMSRCHTRRLLERPLLWSP